MTNNDKLIELCPDSVLWSPLEELARDGARKMLALALEMEVTEFIKKYENLKDDNGKRLVVKNGYHPERDILTGIGKLSVKQPRVDDRRIRKSKSEPEFSSRILPKYLRRFPSIDNLLPVLYLKGISTKAFPVALESILGKNAKNISPGVIVNLKSKWLEEYEAWKKRDLSQKEYVYFWVDGIYCKARLENEKSCLLVIIAADKYGRKELLAVNDGYRESKISWKDTLLELSQRGLKLAPKLAIGDGALGFWAALREVFPETQEQRCWVHKTANILDKAPKNLQEKMKSHIHEMYMSETKDEALKSYERFVKTYQDKYPKAVNCLTKDKESLFTFYDFPAAHWRHIRTTNPVESTFATIRLRTKKTKGCGNRTTTLTMVWKLAMEAQRTWIKLHGYQTIIPLMQGKKFIDGILQEELNEVA